MQVCKGQSTATLHFRMLPTNLIIDTIASLCHNPCQRQPLSITSMNSTEKVKSCICLLHF